MIFWKWHNIGKTILPGPPAHNPCDSVSVCKLAVELTHPHWIHQSESLWENKVLECCNKVLECCFKSDLSTWPAIEESTVVSFTYFIIDSVSNHFYICFIAGDDLLTLHEMHIFGVMVAIEIYAYTLGWLDILETDTLEWLDITWALSNVSLRRHLKAA